MAPRDSAAKNKGEYDSCVACYFRDKSRVQRGLLTTTTTAKKRACTGMMGQSQPERCCTVVLRRNKDRQDEEGKRDDDNRERGGKGRGMKQARTRGSFVSRISAAGSGPCAHVFVIRMQQLRRMSKDVYTYGNFTNEVELRDCSRDGRFLRIYLI